MKRIVAKNGELVHIETPLGIINIRAGLSDQKGRKVDSIEILKNEYVGENKVRLDGYVNSRLIELKTVRQK